MNSFKFILFFVYIKNIYLTLDYCTSKTNVTEPNDCVFLSNSTTKCCFNPENKSQCFWESSSNDLKCDVDYFYNYEIGEDKYNEYKDKKGYCTFVYGDIKGAFKYDIKNGESLNINEFNGLIVNCLKNNKNEIKINLIAFFLAIFFIFE